MICLNFDSTRVIIDLDAISANFDAICAKAGVPVMAVIKADAYGHGAIEVARLLQDRAAFFGVSSMLEAMELRQAGLTTPILILGHTPVNAFPTAVQENIRPAIFRYEDALVLSQAAVEAGKPAPFHFAVDTGMSRIGFPPTEEAADLCRKIAQLPGLIPEGCFSHFATADSEDLSRAREQAHLFDAFCTMLQNRGVSIAIRHLNNSAGIMNFDRHYEMVRAGIVTYGMYPSEAVSKALLSLKPALQFVSKVTFVKTLPQGHAVSYGATFITHRETVVATVPVGYADGYRRSLSGKFYCLIHGRKAPILGRICMDQMMVDVTDIPDVQPGDRVTLVGTDGSETITIEQIAAQAHSFNYEFVCGISRRVPRIYVSGGKRIHSVHYLTDPFL